MEAIGRHIHAVLAIARPVRVGLAHFRSRQARAGHDLGRAAGDGQAAHRRHWESWNKPVPGCCAQGRRGDQKQGQDRGQETVLVIASSSSIAGHVDEPRRRRWRRRRRLDRPAIAARALHCSAFRVMSCLPSGATSMPSRRYCAQTEFFLAHFRPRQSFAGVCEWGGRQVMSNPDRLRRWERRNSFWIAPRPARSAAEATGSVGAS